MRSTGGWRHLSKQEGDRKPDSLASTVVVIVWTQCVVPIGSIAERGESASSGTSRFPHSSTIKLSFSKVSLTASVYSQRYAIHTVERVSARKGRESTPSGSAQLKGRGNQGTQTSVQGKKRGG